MQTQKQQQQYKKLTEPIKIGDLELKNRMIMAPLTRSRTDPNTNIPNDLMLEYYTQRAGFGLIITECSQISDISDTYPGSGAIFSKDHADGWKKVVDSVHKENGKIFIQLWHCGRAVISEFIGGKTPFAPSPIAITDMHPTGVNYPVPKEMTHEDIKTVIEQYRHSAVLAKEAGFDGVELHGANGFLVDQFLRDRTNKRTDKYGGSVENRCRFLFEVLDALISVFGAGRVGLRLSPTGRYHDNYDSNPLELMKYLLPELSKLNLAFLEVKRHGAIEGLPKRGQEQVNDKKGLVYPELQIPDFFPTLRSLYKGTFIGNDNIKPEEGEKYIEDGILDAVSFGTLAIGNPDLAERIENNYPVNYNIDKATMFAGTAPGYTDYPTYKQQQEQALLSQKA